MTYKTRPRYKMSCLTRFGPAILENRCSNYGKVLAAISRNNSESRSDQSSSKNRPMVTASELNLSDSNLIIENDIDEIAVPTTCCMSGCTNCVWIQYAELLSEKLKKSDGDMEKIIMDKVEDPNMRAFLMMELRCRNLGKS